MKFKQIIILLITLFIGGNINAWDEVTHAFMTNMIPELIEDAELKTLLQNNRDEFIYGCWYTDTYQYTKSKNNRVNTLNPHYIATYGEAFKKYLQKEEVIQQENYAKLVALYLGSLSHLLEDFWYDSNLNKYQKTKDDKYKGDASHGAFVAKQFSYIGLKVKPYLPVNDLFLMYKDAGMLEEKYDTPEKLKALLNDWSNQQYLLLRSLKFINFLAGNQMFNASPWTAGNLKEIKGGMINSAEVASIFIVEVWKSLKNKQEPKILHADYFEFENKLAFLTSIPVSAIDFSSNDIFLLSNSTDTIRGEIIQFEHSDKKKGITKYAISFYPETKLETGKEYTLTAKANHLFPKPFFYTFKTGTYIEKTPSPKPYINTISLGIFGFIPLLALSGLLFGIGGIIRFNWAYSNGYKKQAIIRLLFQRLLQLASILIFSYGIYVLTSRGEMIIDWVL